MTNIGGNACCNPCGSYCESNNKNGYGSYAFILVLFILLVICGAAFLF